MPYLPDSFALPTLLPLVDQKRYPVDKYPDGQFDYFRYYLTHFDQATRDFDADIPALLSIIYRPGDPTSGSEIYRSALITRSGGWFGLAHRAPAVPPDLTLWPRADFDALIEAY